MTSITIREIDLEVAQKISALARAEGKSRESWLRDLIIRAAKEPVVQKKYTIKVYGISGKGTLRRSDLDDFVSAGFSNFNEVEVEAFEKAKDLIHRNSLGDRERALTLLQEVFSEVFVEY